MKSATKHIVSFKVGLPDMTMDAFNDEMQTSFIADVATKLEVEPDAVDIAASAGSVNVDVKVSVADAEAASTVAASAEAAKTDLVNPDTFGPCEVSGVAFALRWASPAMCERPCSVQRF